MKVYLVRASEWETDVDCVCATKKLAIRECERLAREYGIEDDDYEDYIQYTKMELIEE